MPHHIHGEGTQKIPRGVIHVIGGVIEGILAPVNGKRVEAVVLRQPLHKGQQTVHAVGVDRIVRQFPDIVVEIILHIHRFVGSQALNAFIDSDGDFVAGAARLFTQQAHCLLLIQIAVGRKNRMDFRKNL